MRKSLVLTRTKRKQKIYLPDANGVNILVKLKSKTDKKDIFYEAVHGILRTKAVVCSLPILEIRDLVCRRKGIMIEKAIRWYYFWGDQFLAHFKALIQIIIINLKVGRGSVGPSTGYDEGWFRFSV